MYYPVGIPRWVRAIYPGSLWEMPDDGRTVWLTFDDGPDPEVTPRVLDLLGAAGMRATFFCIGDRVARHAELFQRILREGHSVGNHTHRHLDGWKTRKADYLDDIREAGAHIDSRLFRPPYGHIRPAQLSAVRNALGMTPVMWTVLSGDFDTGLSGEACLKRLEGRIRTGRILTFHDSAKAWPRLAVVLPGVLSQMGRQGWGSEGLSLAQKNWAG